MQDPAEEKVSRNYVVTFLLCTFFGMLLGIGAFSAGILRSHRIRLEEIEGRLEEIQHGFNGLDTLHERVSETWLEQLRLQRQLDAQKPKGAKAFPGE